MEVELTNQRVVAIDGGTATGKGRLIDELSQLLRLHGVPVIHLSTGSLYRAVAFAALAKTRPKIGGKRQKTQIQINHEALELLRGMSARQYLEYARPRQIQMHGGVVWMDGEVVSADEVLKAPSVGMGASIVSRQLPVREFVNDIVLRQVNEFNGYVLVDGRDIGTEVVPGAPLKLLLTVSPEVAATRSREHSMEEIIARDAADRNREHGRLPHPDDVAEGVVVVATDSHSPETARDYVYGLMTIVFGDLPKLT